MELTDKQKRKLLSAADIVEKGDMAVLEKILEFEDTIDEEKGKIEKKIVEVDTRARDLETEVSGFQEKLSEEIKAEVADIKKEAGAKGEPGNNYVLTEADKKEIAGKIRVPIVERVIEKTEVIREQPILTTEVKEVAIPQSGTEVIEKINSDETEGLIKRERVEGLDDEFKRIEGKITTNRIVAPSRGLQLYVGGVKKGLAQYVNLVAGPNVAVSDSFVNGLHTITISASGGSGFSQLSATETPNGILTVFTFASALTQPSFLVVDGVWMQATTAMGTVNWTWNAGTAQATLSVPAQDDIFAVV